MPRRVKKTLGEIALRVSELPVMRDFYRDVIQLDLIRETPKFVFFRIAAGVAGHTQVLALFDRNGDDEYVSPVAEKTTIDHLAFSMSKIDFDIERRRLLALGCELSYAYHQWVQWRSLYLNDPEGNTVEFVCFDETADLQLGKL